MKNLIIFTACLVIIHSCKKDKTSSYTIKGQIVACINGIESPYLGNTGIDLFQQKNGSNNKSKVLANTTTDAQRNFSFTYSTTNDYDKLMIRESSGFGFNRIITNIPIQDISNLKVYYAARYNVVVSVNAVKPYTILDTLFVVKKDSLITIKVVGPFINKRLFKLINFPVIPEMIFGSNGEIQRASLNNNIDLSKEYIIENSKLCGDTVYVNIDVR